MKVGETWMPFWRAYLQCHLISRSRSGIAKASRQARAAVALDPRDDVVGRGFHVWPAAVTFEFEFLAMRRDRGHHRLRRLLPGLQGRGRHDAAHDHARIHVPWLGLKPELDRDAIFTGLASSSSSLPNALTEYGHVGSRNISKTRGPLPHTSGSAYQGVDGIRLVLLLGSGERVGRNERGAQARAGRGHRPAA